MDPLAHRALRIAADLVCPERCAACPAIVPHARLFCHACAERVHTLGPPECGCCGDPSDADPCPRCTDAPDTPIRYARAWAVYRGDGEASPVARAVAALKYQGAIRLGRRLAAVMLPRVPDPAVAVVVPVPLHARKLRARGFNQSAVLARHLARALGRPASLRALARTRDTASQTALSPPARLANLSGAFVVAETPSVRGRTVLLIDDVLTSGATARAAATALRDAGARAVDLLTLARVLPARGCAKAGAGSRAAVVLDPPSRDPEQR